MVLEKLAFELLAVHPQLPLGCCQFVEQFLHCALLGVVLVDKVGILADELLVLRALVRIELIEPELHLLVNGLQLVLDILSLLLHLLALDKNLVKFGLELLVIVLNVLVSVLDVLRPCVGSEFVEGQVVVGQLSLELPDFVVQLFQFALQLVVELLLFTDLLALVFQLCRLLLHALTRPITTIIFSFVFVM